MAVALPAEGPEVLSRQDTFKENSKKGDIKPAGPSGRLAIPKDLALILRRGPVRGLRCLRSEFQGEVPQCFRSSRLRRTRRRLYRRRGRRRLLRVPSKCRAPAALTAAPELGIDARPRHRVRSRDRSDRQRKSAVSLACDPATKASASTPKRVGPGRSAVAESTGAAGTRPGRRDRWQGPSPYPRSITRGRAASRTSTSASAERSLPAPPLHRSPSRRRPNPRSVPPRRRRGCRRPHKRHSKSSWSRLIR